MPNAAQVLALTFVSHLTRQAAFSRATFGPGPRTKGVMDHIRKELDEVAKALDPAEKVPVHPSVEENYRKDESIKEWSDVAILGLDGLTRAIWDRFPNLTADQVAEEAVAHILGKQGKNEKRDWPDWRTASSDKAIEHVRGAGE